jgi:hypothetical protein
VGGGGGVGVLPTSEFLFLTISPLSLSLPTSRDVLPISAAHLGPPSRCDATPTFFSEVEEEE